MHPDVEHIPSFSKNDYYILLATSSGKLQTTSTQTLHQLSSLPPIQGHALLTRRLGTPERSRWNSLQSSSRLRGATPRAARLEDGTGSPGTPGVRMVFLDTPR